MQLVRLLPQNGVLIVIISILVLKIDLDLVVGTSTALLVACVILLLLVLDVGARIVVGVLCLAPIGGLRSVYRPLGGA